ncbi:MAG TPA: hypothetical protein VKA63_08780 [Candidatus Krumholzibacteria bacterium]|nr:hypothetical protein [Candidatus Krumholzibacteria bacterium]
MMKAFVALLCLLTLTTVAKAAELENAVARRVNYLSTQLSLEGDQAKAIEQILDTLAQRTREDRSSMGERRPEGDREGSGPPEEKSDSSKMEERAQKTHDSVLALLSPQQAASYQTLVDKENEWWLDPQLLQMDTMLSLTLDQCRKIYPVLRRSRLRLRALRESVRHTRDQGAMDSLRKEMRESNEVILEFLDTDQKEIWKDHIEAVQKQREKIRSQHRRNR